MKVLLVSANTETINMPVLPLGMAFVARAAEEAGYEVAQMNLMAKPEAINLLKKRILSIQPDIIGISIRNIDDQVSLQPRFLLELVKPVMATCRQYFKGPIVLGGAGYSIFPQSVLDYLDADMGIQGEGEQAFVTLLDRLNKNEDLSDIPGLYATKQKIGNPPAIIKKIDRFAIPLPGRHLFLLDGPKNDTVWVPFQTRRGCPLNCSYCSTPSIEGKITRKRNFDSVIEALNNYRASGFDHFFFVDNTFNLPLGYATRLCEEIIASGLNISWRAILHPWKVDEKLVHRMAEAGCLEVSLGFESGSDPILKKMNKHYSLEDIRHVAGLLRQAGIRRMGFLLLGGPGETRRTVEESLEFVDSLTLDMVKVTAGIRIYPGTRLASYARRTGKVVPDDNLLFPRFYLENDLEAWLRSTIGDWMAKRSNWIG